MKVITYCIPHFQADCSCMCIRRFLTQVFHDTNEAWCIIQVCGLPTITQKFIYEFNFVTSAVKKCKNTAMEIIPGHAGFCSKFVFCVSCNNFNLKTKHWCIDILVLPSQITRMGHLTSRAQFRIWSHPCRLYGCCSYDIWWASWSDVLFPRQELWLKMELVLLWVLWHEQMWHVLMCEW